jgi:hypothetical protein
VERDAIARRLKELFYAQKEKLLGHKYKPATRHAKFEFFQKAADICIELKVPVDTFIKAAFEGARSFKAGPFPNMLTGNAIRAWVKQYLRLRPELRKQVEEVETPSAETAMQHWESQTEFGSELEYALRFIENCTGSRDCTTLSALMVLQRPAAPITAFMRVALTYPNPEFLELYGAEARREFAFNPLLLLAAQQQGYLSNPELLWKTRTSPN